MRWMDIKHWFFHDWNVWRKSRAVGEEQIEERICNYCRGRQIRSIIPGFRTMASTSDSESENGGSTPPALTIS
jgi:hypothetical protein